MGRRRANTPMQDAAVLLASAAAARQDDGSPEDIEAEEIADDVLEGLRKFDQGGNRVTWYVYSDTPGKSGDSEGYVEKLKTEHLDEQRFKSRYGPGEYRVMGRTSDGHYVKGSHKVIKISDIGAETAAPRNPETDVVTLMREMRSADDARQKARDESLKTYATIFAAPLATLAAALLTRKPAIDIPALLTAMRPPQAPPTLADMTATLVNLKAMQGDSGGSNVELVLKVLERVQDLPQGGTGEGGWLGFLRDAIKEVAPHARELLSQRPAAGQLPPGSTSGPPFGPGVLPRSNPGGTAPGMGAPGSNGASPPTPTASDVSPSLSSPAPSGMPPAPAGADPDMWVIAEPWLKRQADNLHEWAASNMEVELCAEMLLASVPKIFRAVLTPADLVGYLQHPDWWSTLTAFHPPLQPYAAWIDDVRQELLHLLNEEVTPPAESDSPERGTTQ